MGPDVAGRAFLLGHGRASRLNQIEIWLSIFTRNSLKGDSFASVEVLVAHIAGYLKAYNQNPVPFARKKREVQGT